jgi:dTDP-4-amino-4,6-dideoxygalactose transaminase
MTQYIFNKRSDLRGSLIPIDAINDLPFDIKRIFYIKNLDNIPRGFHAHKKCEQILVPITGSFTLNLEYKNRTKQSFHLDKDNEGIYIPLLTWLDMENFSIDCIIMVICSYKYNEEEYIRNYEDFLSEINIDKQTIKNFDLSKQTKLIKMEIMNKIENIIDNTAFVLGQELKSFENNFALYNNINYCAGISNGTSAIKCAINSIININNLDNVELIYQANTYVVVPLCATELNLKSNIIDINNNLLLDLNKLNTFLELNKNNNTNFILIIVHLYGFSVDMNKLLQLKNIYNFNLIEDAAQAHGSEFDNQKLGTFGDIGCFSFYPSKNLGAFGEGGAIVTNNKLYYDYAIKYRNYGCINKYEWDIVGSNERMHNLQAGILDIKLKYLNQWNNKRKILADTYINNLKYNSDIIIPSLFSKCKSNYHIFVIITNNRNKLKQYLENNNIQCNIHYPKPFYKRKAYEQFKNLQFEVMDSVNDKLLSLPMYPELHIDDIHFICNIINNFNNK